MKSRLDLKELRNSYNKLQIRGNIPLFHTMRRVGYSRISARHLKVLAYWYDVMEGNVSLYKRN